MRVRFRMRMIDCFPVTIFDNRRRPCPHPQGQKQKIRYKIQGRNRILYPVEQSIIRIRKRTRIRRKSCQQSTENTQHTET